jgi:drug/metabolite transporter (DMT)-like permease
MSSPKPSTDLTAVSELVFAGALWGFGFVATVWVLQFMDPATLLAARFGGAFFLGLLILLFFLRPTRANFFSDLRLALVPSMFLWTTLILQVTGLLTTSATNSSFITTLYVIIVPILQSLRGREKLKAFHWLNVGIAMAGTLLIVNASDLQKWHRGDFLTLICAVTAAIHILIIDARAAKVKNDFQFNVMQSGWMTLFCLLLIPFERSVDLAGMNATAWIGLAALAFGSSMIAFFLQIKAQRTLSASVSAVLFLLESPFACVFALIFLKERLSWSQWIGAGLILLACLGVSLRTKSGSVSDLKLSSGDR